VSVLGHVAGRPHLTKTCQIGCHRVSQLAVDSICMVQSMQMIEGFRICLPIELLACSGRESGSAPDTTPVS